MSDVIVPSKYVSCLIWIQESHFFCFQHFCVVYGAVDDEDDEDDDGDDDDDDDDDDDHHHEHLCRCIIIIIIMNIYADALLPNGYQVIRTSSATSIGHICDW